MQNKIIGKGAEKKEYCAFFITDSGISSKTAITTKLRRDLKQALSLYEPDIVITGIPAVTGIAEYTVDNMDLLKKRLPGWMLDNLLKESDAYGKGSDQPEGIPADLLKDISTDIRISSLVPAMVFPIGQEGIFRALWDVGEALFCGMDIRWIDIPMKQIVIEVCECLSLDPYQLPSYGCFILVCKNGHRVSDILSGKSIPSACIGTITGNAARILRSDEGIRYLTP